MRQRATRLLGVTAMALLALASLLCVPSPAWADEPQLEINSVAELDGRRVAAA